jgi:uncharacterized caspase-like protein
MKRALLVGIDHYQQLPPLAGCVADATAVAEIIRTHADGSPNYQVELITSENNHAVVTREGLRGALARLFGNARGADLFFFFAGHGGQTLWGADLVTQDATSNSLGVSMNDLITLANDSPARSVTLILDCCFSGDLGNLTGLQASSIAEPLDWVKQFWERTLPHSRLVGHRRQPLKPPVTVPLLAFSSTASRAALPTIWAK